MAQTTGMPIAQRRAIDRLADHAAAAPAAAQLPPSALIRALRLALRMSQAQLAKRAGIPQSHLARIESGKGDLQLGTLRKVFSALFCDILVLPRLKRGLEEIIEERVKETARRNVARVRGTMALERQQPDEDTDRALILSEEARLRAHPSSELWAD